MKNGQESCISQIFPEAGRYVTASKETYCIIPGGSNRGYGAFENENNILPLKNGSRITLFGRGSFDYVKGGGGKR